MGTGKLLRLSECAAITGHRVSTWRGWILSGRVAYFKVGGSVRVAERDLELFIQSGFRERPMKAECSAAATA